MFPLKKLNHFFCYLLLFGIPLVVLIIHFNWGDTRLSYLPVKYFLWGMLLAVMLLVTFFQREKFEWKIPHFLLFIFWLWILSSFMWSINRYQSLESFTQWSLIFAFIFLISHLFKRESHYQRAFWVCLISLSIAIVISLFQKYTPLFVVNHTYGFRDSSTFGNYKFISHFSIISLPFFIPLYGWAKSTRQRFAFFVILFLVILHFLLTDYLSKSFWIGLIFNLGFLFLFWVRRIPHFKKIVCMAATVVFIFTLYWGHRSYKKISPEPHKISSSTQQRWLMWKNTKEAIQEKPFLGSGLGTFSIVYSKFEDPHDRRLFPQDRTWPFFTRQSHNDFLQMIQEVGLIGFLLFLVFVISILFPGFRKISQLNLALLLAFFNFLIVSFVYFPFHEPASAVLFSLIVGILISRHPRFFILENKITSFGILLLIPFFIFTSLRFFLSEWYFQRAHFKATGFEEVDRAIQKSLFWNAKDWEKLWAVGLFYLQQEKFDQSKVSFEEALKLNPYMPHLVYNLGLAYLNLEQTSKALSLFNKTLKMAPDFTLAYHGIGLIFYHRNDVKRALKFFQKAQSHPHPYWVESFYMAALCEGRLKHYGLARKEIMEAISMHSEQLLYHRMLSLIEKRGIRQPLKRNHPLGVLQKQLMSKDSEILIRALRQAQITSNAESLTTQIFQLLKHDDRNVRMEATQFFLSLPETALAPLLKMYSMIKNPEVRWRVFYIISEKIPQQALDEARRIYHDREEGGLIKVLSMRFLSKYAPYELVLPTSIGDPFYKLIRFYAMN